MGGEFWRSGVPKPEPLFQSLKAPRQLNPCWNLEPLNRNTIQQPGPQMLESLGPRGRDVVLRPDSAVPIPENLMPVVLQPPFIESEKVVL